MIRTEELRTRFEEQLERLERILLSFPIWDKNVPIQVLREVRDPIKQRVVRLREALHGKREFCIPRWGVKNSGRCFEL